MGNEPTLKQSQLIPPKSRSDWIYPERYSVVIYVSGTIVTSKVMIVNDAKCCDRLQDLKRLTRDQGF
ncbi:MAG: hypothetical protein EBV05_02560 [Cyanobacteria bacterium WB6_1B_304]|nr:hypothetical protein [Cyanobacteria bacterium WB6_1B_304]